MEDIRIDGLTADEWEELANPQAATPEDLSNLGIMQQQDQQQPSKLEKAERQDYQKLGYWQTLGDEVMASAVEASKFFIPKKYELNYTPKTKAGEMAKPFTKYLLAIDGLLLGGEAASGIKSAALAANAPKAANVAGGVEAILKGNKFFKTGKTGLKALGVKGLNVLTQGLMQSAIIDSTIRDVDEGRLADMFGDTDNKFLQWLQTDPNDSTFTAKFKNVVDGAIFTIGLNGAIEAASPILGNIFKNVKFLREGKVKPKQAEEALKTIEKEQTKLEKVANTSDLINNVKAIKEESLQSGEEASQMIVDRFNPQDVESGQEILKILDEGDDIFVHEDGTFAIKVSKWDDAYKVAPEEYKKQLEAIDNFNMSNAGDTAISHQDEAVKHTWTNRGWLGEHEELFIAKKGGGYSVNTKAVNRITNNYKDKWKIDNNVKVEFVDGLTINGKQVEGNTQATTFLGKTAKNQQNAIDKKALQVQKLRDKVTMLEGGNEPVMEALEVAQEELRIAENELKELQKTAKGKNLKPNITIQIDKNTKNPYAVLRDELEHARDIAKGEVPNQSERHFSRYNGLNEGEAASEYTYKKSVGKNNASQNVMNGGQTIEEGVKYNQGDINGQQPRTNEINTKETSGNGLYGTRPSEASEGIPRNDTRRSYDSSNNNGSVIHSPSAEFKQKLEAEGKSINNYKELAASDEDTASFISNFREANKANGKWAAQVYEYSAEEYKQMKLYTAENGKSGFALKPDGDIVSVHSSQKGSLDGLMELAIQNGGNKLDCYDTFLPKVYKKYGFVEVKREKWNEAFKPENWDKEFFKQYNNGEPDVVYMELKKDITPEEPKQLKLDFDSIKTSEDLVENVTEDVSKIKTVEDVGTVLDKKIEIDPEISGTTWKAIAEDADKVANIMEQAEELGLSEELKEALSMNDVKTMDMITRKVLAAQKLGSELADKLAVLGENPPIEKMQSIIDMIDTIGRYTKETGSASGRSLQARKFVNKAVQVFGSLRLSELSKEGVSTVSDLLEVEINKLFDLNFTRGEKLTPQQMKQMLMENILQNENSPFTKLLTDDAEIATKFNDILDDLFKSGEKVTADTINKKLTTAVTEARYREVYNATKLAENNEAKIKTIRNWCDKQGGLTSFYVHNLLSGVGTLAKNVISGGLNTLYFPAKKIVAGYLGGGSALAREGWNTYKNLLSSWQEAWSLGKQAFLNGEGQLSMMKDTMALADEEVFNGFREWKFDFSTPEGIWNSIQNFHSVMTRAMGASDEFMSQLNYRAIKRAKALEQAEKVASQFGIEDETIKSTIADRLFKKAFNSAGKPLDVEALAEAKDILYQLPLNGQVFDRTTGEMVQVRPQTWVTQFAGGVNSGAAKNPLLKIMFPFVKTGANILQQNLEHNGIYAILSNSQRQLLKSDTRAGALARSQVAFGMFSFMAAAGLAISGMVTGSAPTDKKERAALFETGWKPYSIRFGDKYISYQGYEPVQTILGFAADSVNILGNITNSEDEARWEKFSQQIMATAINNFLDKAAFRTGLRQLAFMTSPDENVEEFKKALAQTAQGFLPDSSMVRSTSSMFNRSLTAPQSPYERIFNNYFNRGLGDYRRDVFGNRQDNFGLLVTNVAPDNAKQPEYEEMEYLSQYGFSPSDISKTIEETTLKYKEFKDPTTGRSVYDTMQEELSTIEIDGKTLQEAVRELVTSQEYQDLPLGVNMNGYKYSATEDTKLNAIREIFVEYNKLALRNVINEYGDLYLDNKGRTMSEAVEEVQMEKMNQSINQDLNHNLTNKILKF